MDLSPLIPSKTLNEIEAALQKRDDLVEEHKYEEARNAVESLKDKIDMYFGFGTTYSLLTQINDHEYIFKKERN